MWLVDVELFWPGGFGTFFGIFTHTTPNGK